MRRVINWLLVIGILWGAYWGIAAWALREGITTWFTERGREGWYAEYDALETRGFPLHHSTRVLAPSLADPGTGTAWSADWIAFDSAAVSPTTQTLSFPASAQRFSYFDATLTLRAEGLRAGLGLAPGRALELEQLDLISGPWQVDTDTGPALSGNAFFVQMLQGDTPTIYEITGRVPDLAPLGATRALLPATHGLPAHLEALEFRATAEFDTAWDRRALELHRPQPRHITLHGARLQWGPMQINAVGAVAVDETGLPTGDITLQARDWMRMLTLAEETGLLPAVLRRNLEQALTLLAGRGGHPERLELRLSFARGQVFLGPLPLGPAPRFVLH